MLHRNKIESIVDELMFVIVLLGIIHRIWNNPVIEFIVNFLCTLFFLMLALLLYLTWRDTHSFRQVYRQNRLNVILFIIIPLGLVLLILTLR